MLKPKNATAAFAAARARAGAQEREDLRNLPGLAGAVQRAAIGWDDAELEASIERELEAERNAKPDSFVVKYGAGRKKKT